MSIRALAAGAVFSAAAWAGPGGGIPSASLLVFPHYDSRFDELTLVSVTNTLSGPGGAVRLHYVYIDGVSWTEFDRYEPLTAGDTLTVIAGSHNPLGGRGWLWVRALDPDTDRPIDFDYLVGDLLVLGGSMSRAYAAEAAGFRALAHEANAPIGRSASGHAFADLNGDGSAQFDGVEYERWPDVLVLSSFVEQRGAIEDRVILLTSLPGGFRVDLRLLLYSNDERQYSGQASFRCWADLRLLDLAPVTGRLQGTAAELPTGWLRLDGTTAVHQVTGTRVDRPPVLGLVLRSVGSSIASAHLLHARGERDGLALPPTVR